MLEKNQVLTLECTGLGSELEGVCRQEGLPVFVPGILPGETARVQVVKVQKGYAFGRVAELLTESPERREPFCSCYARCGGCSGQHMSYPATLEAKREQVLECFNRIGGFALTSVPPVLGMEKLDPTAGIRNKTALPIGGTRENPVLGFYRRRSHDIIPLRDCPVAMGPLGKVVEVLRDWICSSGAEPYNELTGKGLLRHGVFRVNRQGEWMLTLTATRDRIPKGEMLVQELKTRVPGFIGLHLSVNSARNNVILGSTSRKLFGADVLTETIHGLTFEIPPLSFFQVNPAQTEVLYDTAIRFAALAPTDTVVDAYCGAGTISLCMAGRVKKVIGIEIVPQAIEGARRNAERNHITNAEFYAAPVEDLLPELVAQGLRPDVVVLDPPRKGAEPQVLKAILAAQPRRVVYVSCHVPTQARDGALLREGGYRLEAVQPVDLFCYAGGVENVAVFVLN